MDRNPAVPILMADDDPDDQMLVRDAFEAVRLRNELFFVNDGEELLEFLRHTGRYAGGTHAPRPGIVLLDLNMPRMDGREALARIKSDPELRTIPVIVLTTSKAEEDVLRSYSLGVNSFITKPVTFDGLVSVVSALGNYWVDIVELPQT